MKLQVSHIKKSFGAQDVLLDASLQVKNNEKIALVGRNGCGKSTLLKIIDGSLPYDQGNRFVSKQIEIGVIDQISFDDLDCTVYDELLKAFSHVIELEQQLQQQATILQTKSDEKELKKYEEIQTQFERYNGYEYEVELKQVFYHFQFEEEDLYKPLSHFSSGQRTRIALVKLLLGKPDVLLLDEPTNHLDIESIEWLENYIRQYPMAVILVSHDRTFIDRVADEIIEIEFGKTMRFVGNYTHYVQAKKEYLAQNQDAYTRQQKEIQRLENLIERFRYKKTKAKMAQSKIKALERMDKIEKAQMDTSSINANFQCLRPSGQDVLQVDNGVFGYDTPLTQASFSMQRGQRLGIVGKNGIGKSTLIKTLVGKMELLEGSIYWGHHVDIGYFDQDSAQRSSNETLLDVLWNEDPNATQTEIRSILARFLFTQEEVFKEVSMLSGGERVRLALAILMIRKDNVLVLDEPTNHLDIPAKEALEDALLDYPGTILFVSHDRMFLEKMSTCVLEVDAESQFYALNYHDFLEKGDTAIPVEPVKQISVTKESFVDQKALKNRVAKLETLIHTAEEELEELREYRFEPEYYQDYKKMEELNEQIDEKHNEIARYMKEWEDKMNEMENH